MRLTLTIDGVPHQIDSTDPELLGKWIVEIFGRLRMIYPSTQIDFQASPSFVPAEDGDMISGRGGWVPDWAADSRVICQRVQIRSPRELVEALSNQLDQLDELTQKPASSRDAGR